MSRDQRRATPAAVLRSAPSGDNLSTFEIDYVPMEGVPVMRLRRAPWLAVGGSALLALVLAACGGSATSGSTGASGAAGTGGTLTVAMASGITSLNPIENGTGLPNQTFLQPAYDSLIIRSSTGALTPELATAWSYSDGNKEFHLTLRSGVKFSNGQALTAQGVADWIEWFKNGNGQFSSRFDDVKSITVNGPLSLTMNLTQADAAWPSSFTQDRYGFVVCPAQLKSSNSLGTTTCGAGPYILSPAQTVSGSKYVYVPNKNYWNKSAVHWNQVVVEAITSPNSVVAAMASGQVQVAVGTPQTASAANGAGVQIVAAPELWDSVEIFNRGGSGPLGNLKVRQALEYAIDRKTLTTAVFGKYAQPNTGMLVSGLPGYSSSEGSQYSYDPAKAKQLLAQAGYPNGFPMTVATWNRNGLENTLAQAILPYFQAVGVKASLVTVPDATTLESGLGANKWQDLVFFGQSESPNLLTQEQLLPASGILNPEKYTDKPLIALYNQYNAAASTSAQTSLLQQMQTYIDNQAYYITSSVSDQIYFHTSSVTGVDVSGAEPILNLYTITPAS
jgi:peptide/nickel transport system substrate-binding protein